MKKRILIILLLAIPLLACRLSSTPVQIPTQTRQPEATSTATASQPDPVAPVGPVDGLTVQNPMVSDPNAGQAKFRLMELGYDICTITTDYYNYQVEAAVLQFQSAAGLTPNGVLDSITLEHLLAADAPSRPSISPVPLNTSDMLYVQSGDTLAMTPDSIWILQGWSMVQFSMQGDFLGFYTVGALPGEESYAPTAMVFDGTLLWIAQQGQGDTLVQAYDPETANPTDGLLNPVLSRSIHFPSIQLYSAAAFDGQNVWFLIDDPLLGYVSLQPINVNSNTAGTQIVIGESSGYGYNYGIAPDPDTGTLWITYGDEVFGEQAIVAVDPQTGEVGPALGACGMRVTYALSRLWFVNQQGLWSVDPVSGERTLYDYYADEQVRFATEAGNLWIMDSSGTLVKVVVP